MDQMGYLIISIAAVKLMGRGYSVNMMQVQINKIHASRTEALCMMREHKKQSRREDGNQNYSYDWQPEREDWNEQE